MEQLSIFSQGAFVATTCISICIWLKAIPYKPIIGIGMVLWMGIQAILGLQGFYLNTQMPPRFLLMLLPPVLLSLVFIFGKKNTEWQAESQLRWLTLIHVIRIPIEVILWDLARQKAIPELMTFEGSNWDIVAGLSAPLVYYYGFVTKIMPWTWVRYWHFACLALLANIVITAILAAPTPLQQWAFEQPNRAIMYFPFVWLPSVVVPIVFFSHLLAIKQLSKK